MPCAELHDLASWPKTDWCSSNTIFVCNRNLTVIYFSAGAIECFLFSATLQNIIPVTNFPVHLGSVSPNSFSVSGTKLFLHYLYVFFFCIGALILQWLSWTLPSYRKLTIAEVCSSNVLQNVLPIEQRYIFTYRYLMMLSFSTQLGLKETAVFKYLQLFL